jgi:glycosyltransferase involved in cell wall biosynthesis
MDISETNRPLLSIVTINKNNAGGVKRTIASLLPLKHDPAIEYLFIDGLSTDESILLASAFYQTTRLVSEPDGGIYQAMNKGLALASGDWVVWLNSGDEWIADCWPALRNFLQTTQARILCAAAEIVDHRTGACINIRGADPSHLPWGMVNHSSTIFRRHALLHYNGYNETYRIAADRELLVRLHLNREPIEYCDRCLSRFWLGGLSDQELLLRAQENLRLDLQAGLITPSAYYYGRLRHFLFYCLARPGIITLRGLLKRVGIELPPLGSYAGLLGELRRDAFAGKNQR